MVSESVIVLEDVSICFYVRESGHISLKEMLLQPRRYSLLQKQFVLRNINLDIKKGESIGLLGKNGSGKSTLLRAISGIIQAEQGKITVKGKVAPLLSLGVGLEHELTGLENIRLSCALMGLSKTETANVEQEIIEFSELGTPITWPVKRYSTGMMSRLAFSIAILNQPDILLIDEVLAVGDKGFQDKCLEKIMEMKAKGTTVVFVSHSYADIQSLCTKAALIHEGGIRAFGPVEEVGPQYLNLFH
jgi:lipopolysaccharide transport system ATP-binding protein